MMLIGLLIITMFLAGCSHGLQETAFAVPDEKDGVHYVVTRDVVASRVSANQPHTAGQYHCRSRYTSEQMATMRQWVTTDHTWYKDCTPIKQHPNHNDVLTSDQSWASVWQGPLSAALLAGGLVGMGALWPEDQIINSNSATGGAGGSGGIGMGGAGGRGGAGGAGGSIRGPWRGRYR